MTPEQALQIRTLLELTAWRVTVGRHVSNFWTQVPAVYPGPATITLSKGTRHGSQSD